MMKKENKKGQTMKFLDAYYDFSNGVANILLLKIQMNKTSNK